MSVGVICLLLCVYSNHDGRKRVIATHRVDDSGRKARLFSMMELAVPQDWAGRTPQPSVEQDSVSWGEEAVVYALLLSYCWWPRSTRTCQEALQGVKVSRLSALYTRRYFRIFVS